LTSSSLGGVELKKINKKTVIGKIAAIIMIASICSLTVVIPCFADYANNGLGNSGMRTYPNTYGIDVITIRDPNYTLHNGVYSTDKYKNRQNPYSYDYYDPSSVVSSSGVFKELASRTSSNVFGSNYEYYRRDFLINTPNLLRMELSLGSMLLGVENGYNDAYLPLCAISCNQDFYIDGYIDGITYSFTYYDRINNKMEFYEDVLTTDSEFPIYAVKYGTRGLYIRFNPDFILETSPYAYVSNLSINTPSKDEFPDNIEMGVTTYCYGFYEDVALLSNGIQLLPPSEMNNLFKLTIFNDVVGFSNIGDFLDKTLQSVVEAEFFPGLAIGGVLTLILLLGLLAFSLKAIIGGL
jgi:hypothetical protein